MASGGIWHRDRVSRNEHMSRNDYPCSERHRKAAARRLPRFDYIDGSVVTECGKAER